LIKLVYTNIYLKDGYLRRFDEGIKNSIISHFGKENFKIKTNSIKFDNLEFIYPDINKIIVGNSSKKRFLNLMLV